MSRPKILFHDISQGDAVEREMNDEEYAHFLKIQSKLIEEYEKNKAKELARENALKKLQDLGLTRDEIASLL